MSKRPVVYVPPSPEVLEHFAHDAYFEMGCCDRENEKEFAGFMIAVSRALAKDLTRKANSDIDSRIE